MKLTTKITGHDASEATLPFFTFGEASRFDFFSRMLSKVDSLEGDLVECGVGWGRSLIHLLSIMHKTEKVRNLWAFDSFEGFPEPTKEDISFRNPRKGEWRSDIRSIEKMLHDAGFSDEYVRQRLIFVKGYFEDTLSDYRGAPIAFLHADADLYESYRSILERLYDHVLPGGVIVFDEYRNTWEHEKFPGAAMAIDEFFEGKERIVRDGLFGKFYVVKGCG